MVQALSAPTVSLELVPLQAPGVNLTKGVVLSAVTDDVTAVVPGEINLLFQPGISSELLLRLTNRTEQPLVSTITLSGSLPKAWLLTPIEPYQLAPWSVQDVVLTFYVPEDFFETLTAFAPGECRPLNYSARVDVYSYVLNSERPDEGEELENEGLETEGLETENLETTDLEESKSETLLAGVNAESDNTENTSIERLEQALLNAELAAIASERFTAAVRPNSPYLRLLPQIYQEIDLAGRLMAIVEHALMPDVEMLGSLWAYLDPLLAPEAMLPFLAHWVGWQALPQLTWHQQRRLIARAIELYNWRGTAYGLRLYLHVVTGLPLEGDDTPLAEQHITVLEPSRQGAVFGESVFDEDTVFGSGQAYHFAVVLRYPEEIPAGVMLDETVIRAIIDQERPAFCTYELYILPML